MGRLSRQELSISRIVVSLCPAFCWGIYCTINACMCFFSLWTGLRLAYKKYCVLRKDTGAKKGPRGPMKVLAVLVEARQGIFVFLSEDSISFGSASAFSIKLRLILGCGGFCSCPQKSFTLSFKSVFLTVRSSWEWSKTGVCCLLRLGGLRDIQHCRSNLAFQKMEFRCRKIQK